MVSLADDTEVLHLQPAFGELADRGLGSVVVGEYSNDCVILGHRMFLLKFEFGDGLN